MGSVTLMEYDPPQCAPGETCPWTFHDDDSGVTTTLAAGRLLGYATSQWRDHNHSSDDYSLRQQHHPAARPCSACRWIEVRIVQFRPERPDAVSQYIVSYIGRTTLPGERDRHSCCITPSAHRVIEVLTQTKGDGRQFIPRVSRLALSEAAGLDATFEAAWIERPL